MGYFGIPFRNGVPIGLGSIAGFGAPQEFSPSELFLGGTAGAWYDPSDLTTLFTTSAGTTQCAMPGQGSAVSVGLMLDKSQGLVLGSELVTNGGPGFVNTTGWATQSNATVSVDNGELKLVSSTNSSTAGYFDTTTVAGATYRVVCSIRTTTASANVIQAWNGAFSSLLREINIGASTTTTVTFYFQATGTTTRIAFGPGNAASTVFLASITVKAVAGNHAIAFNDTTARPELRARVNLLVATATLSTQSVTTQATSYTLSFAGTGSIALSGTATGSYSAGTHTITCTAGTLTLTVSGTVTTADLRPANSGALLPAYQAVVDANTYDTSGFPLYLRFDGIDDSMYTPANLNLSGTDKVSVFAGVRRLTNTAGCVTELTSGTTNGLSLFASTIGGNSWFFSAFGASQLYGTVAPYNAPITNVLTEQLDKAALTDATRISARVNAAAVSLSYAGSLVVPGNFANAPLYIGARNNSNFWLDGHLHSLILVGSAVSAGNISATEQWVANKTGIVIP